MRTISSTLVAEQRNKKQVLIREIHCQKLPESSNPSSDSRTEETNRNTTYEFLGRSENKLPLSLPVS